MNEAQLVTYTRDNNTMDFKHLPSEQRMVAAERKYAEAVSIYASTNLSLRVIAEKCGVTPAGLSAHIAKHHRDLLFERYGLDTKEYDFNKIKIKQQNGQSLITHLKYKEAIEACGDIAYIECNISQIARQFNLDGTALSSQLRVHYPDIIPNREKVRKRLGIADNNHRGPQKESIEVYTNALEMYRDTNMTIPEVAEECKISKSGFSRFMRFYHQDIVKQKSARRKAAKRKVGLRKSGRLSGNGSLYGPKAETIDLYSKALDLYCHTPMTIREIVENTGVTEAGFRGYLHQWHRGEKLLRRGYEWDGDSAPDLKGTKRYLKSTAAKYAPAIASIKANPRSVAEVAKEFGLNPEVFREYLKTHEPELVAEQGMTRRANGKLVKRSSSEKYAQAIHEYATTAEPLKSIAQRHGIVYNSLCGYVTRNCPEERASHQRIVEKAERLR